MPLAPTLGPEKGKKKKVKRREYRLIGGGGRETERVKGRETEAERQTSR